MKSSAVVTAPILIEADRVVGVACELLIECIELFVSPLKEFRTIRGLEDLGPLIPEWSEPTPTYCSVSTEILSTSKLSEQPLPGLAA